MERQCVLCRNAVAVVTTKTGGEICKRCAHAWVPVEHLPRDVREEFGVFITTDDEENNEIARWLSDARLRQALAYTSVGAAIAAAAAARAASNQVGIG